MTEDELHFCSGLAFLLLILLFSVGSKLSVKLYINFLDKSGLMQRLTETEFYFIGRKGRKQTCKGNLAVHVAIIGNPEGTVVPDLK